jgi:hypothetical protein
MCATLRDILQLAVQEHAECMEHWGKYCNLLYRSMQNVCNIEGHTATCCAGACRMYAIASYTTIIKTWSKYLECSIVATPWKIPKRQLPSLLCLTDTLMVMHGLASYDCWPQPLRELANHAMNLITVPFLWCPKHLHFRFLVATYLPLIFLCVHTLKFRTHPKRTHKGSQSYAKASHASWQTVLGIAIITPQYHHNSGCGYIMKSTWTLSGLILFVIRNPSLQWTSSNVHVHQCMDV